MEHETFAYTIGMEQNEIEERLRSTKTGVLALANDSDAYAVPLAHHYDGEVLYFRLGEKAKGRKDAFLENTRVASYVVYGTEETENATELESWSIIATGSVHELSESERDQFGPERINRWFAPLRVFGESIPELEITITKFEIDTIVGRRTPSQ